MVKSLATTWMMAVLLIGGTLAPAWASEKAAQLPLAPVGDDGLYKQPWMPETFLDMREDLTTAAEEGKMLALIWEQKGCPYCKETHQINFRDAAVVKYITDNFIVLQMNMWGDREVTDFDGEAMPEKAFAQKYGVLFTPTIQFFPATFDELDGKSGREAEAFRLPGYFRNFHLKNAFLYVKEGRYKNQNFQRFITEKAAEQGGM